MKVVCYCRLSKDDNKSRYSSIKAQMELAKEYADSQGWIISKYYIDDNVSGYISNDERPEFSKMLQDKMCIRDRIYSYSSKQLKTRLKQVLLYLQLINLCTNSLLL